MRAACSSSIASASASITGPTSVSSRSRIAEDELRRGAREDLEHARRDVLLQAKQPATPSSVARRC
jgi:hypothetical protein